MKLILALATLLASASCTGDHNQSGIVPSATAVQGSEAMERALIIGSAEASDPVLNRVRELEEDGVVKDVVVMESFPVQIRLSAPRRIIDELTQIPRVGAIQ